MSILLLRSLCLTLLFYLFSVSNSQENGKTSITDIEISVKTLTSFEFHGRQLQVKEHSANGDASTKIHQRRYFVFPIVELRPEETELLKNPFDKSKSFIHVEILMWNDELRDAALQAIKKVFPEEGKQIQAYQVLQYPADTVRLAIAGRVDSKYMLTKEWKTHIDRPSELNFVIECATLDDCLVMNETLREYPEQALLFLDLRLEYSLTGQRSVGRRIQILWKHVMSTKVASSLQVLPGIGTEKSDRYLTAEDANNFFEEVASNVVAQVTTDSGYVSSRDEISIKDIVQGKLKNQETTADRLNKQAWESVFWNKDIARPDKTTSTFNKHMKKVDGEKRFIFASESANSAVNTLEKSASAKVSGSGYGITASAEASGSSKDHSETASSNSISVDNMTRLLDDSGSEVRWNGERFEPKPMKLVRVNVGSRSESFSLATTQVQLHTVTTVQRWDVSIWDDAKDGGGVPPWYFWEQKLKKIRAEIKTIKADLVKQNHNVKNDLSKHAALITKNGQSIDRQIRSVSDLSKRVSKIEPWIHSHGSTVDICEGKAATIRCPGGGKIRYNYYSTFYGRLIGSTICHNKNAGNTNCRETNRSRRYVSRQCNNKSSCRLEAKNGLFGDPCRGTYKYLHVEFTCRY